MDDVKRIAEALSEDEKRKITGCKVAACVFGYKGKPDLMLYCTIVGPEGDELAFTKTGFAVRDYLLERHERVAAVISAVTRKTKTFNGQRLQARRNPHQGETRP